MNFSNIFKMELYKFFNEKALLIAACVIGIINIISASLIVMASYGNIDSSSALGLYMVFIMFPSVLVSIILVLIYPFQCVGIDYKNNVLATMVASGVDRLTYYFTKLAAVIVNTLILTFIIGLIPFIIMTFINIDFSSFNEIIGEFFTSTLEQPMYYVSEILNYFQLLVIIVLCSMLTRGSLVLSILSYFAFTMVIGIVRLVVTSIFQVSSYYDPGIYYTINAILSLVFMVIILLISINRIIKQDL